MDLVSICIPSYKPDFFRECLTSAIAQTYRNTEIIVSDDCPTSEIEKICSDFAGFVTYVRNPTPGLRGINNIKNISRMAKGKYVKFLFDDDILHPFCVQYLVEAMEFGKEHNAALAFSPRGLINSTNGYMSTVNVLNATKISLIRGAELIALMAATINNPVGEFTTVLLKRDALFDENGEPNFMDVEGHLFMGLADVAAWINMALKGAVAFHPFVLSYFRQHPNSNSNASYNPNLIYAVTDWGLVLSYAKSHGMLVGDGLRAAHMKLIAVYEYWSKTYPQLENEIVRLKAEVQTL